ncbi:SCO family protein [Pseudomonas sp. GD03944]|uniref:SCO family protein n=1 Tax=Pseudomonas sp. GD03944 TaxID=2975409 RepID=UPI002448E809|nr:SCO family protein [Pseudomonas sp. GD03944]MDH1261590.1 SCO family protein [Pseudomonas sp. GD03944]
MNTRRKLLAGAGVAALGLAAWRAGSLAQPAAPQPRAAGSSRFPNVTLYTHEGKAVKFYDDLVRGKVVALNMMYTQCERSCPTSTANLRHVQKLLGERAGRDVFMYSLSLQPELDTPERLQEYVTRYRIGPGWLFLTGARADIDLLRRSLGFYDVDPVVDFNDLSHTGMLRVGNDALDRWTMAPTLTEPLQILSTINHVDSRVVHTAYRATEQASVFG